MEDGGGKGFTPSMFIQEASAQFNLRSFLEPRSPQNVRFQCVWVWPVFDLGEIGSIAFSVQVVLVLCQTFDKTSIQNPSEFSKDAPLSSNISLPEIFLYKEQCLLLWSWCLDYFCFHLPFSCLLHYLPSKDILVNLCHWINQNCLHTVMCLKKYI